MDFSIFSTKVCEKVHSLFYLNTKFQASFKPSPKAVLTMRLNQCIKVSHPHVFLFCTQNMFYLKVLM